MAFWRERVWLLWRESQIPLEGEWGAFVAIVTVMSLPPTPHRAAPQNELSSVPRKQILSECNHIILKITQRMHSILSPPNQLMQSTLGYLWRRELNGRLIVAIFKQFFSLQEILLNGEFI